MENQNYTVTFTKGQLEEVFDFTARTLTELGLNLEKASDIEAEFIRKVIEQYEDMYLKIRRSLNEVEPMDSENRQKLWSNLFYRYGRVMTASYSDAPIGGYGNNDRSIYDTLLANQNEFTHEEVDLAWRRGVYPIGVFKAPKN